MTNKSLQASARAGFSIIELLIYMGLLSIFIVVLTSIFISALDIQLNSGATSNVEQEGRFILNRLTYDVHRASSVTTPTANQLTLTIGGAGYTYVVSGSQLQLTTGTGTNTLNESDTKVSGFSVSKRGGAKPAVEILFTIAATTTDSQPKHEVRNYQTTIGIR